MTRKHIATARCVRGHAFELVAQQNIGQLMFSNCMKLSVGQPISLENFFYAVNQEALHVLEKGMYPIYSRVAANAKRLS